MFIIILGLLAATSASSTSENKESYKNQLHKSGHAGKHKGEHENFSSEYCTDPRTMKKHPAYTEWADAYSCTRHRCQPGGRNLAIYTVGCKRVEAPESAIECEEVVEDTNMQFPFCCTRLRCLVVVRGEVWTRVLGQPWEVLPAAPWSHMYKMKKPPPSDSTFLPKTIDQGPVYELSENEPDHDDHDKVLRSGKQPVTDTTDFNEIASVPVPRSALPPPDIVIALTTNEGKESSHIKISQNMHNKGRKSNAQPPAKYFEVEEAKEKQAEPVNEEVEDVPSTTEKPQEALEEENEKFLDNNNNNVAQKPPHKSHNSHNTVSWTEIPENQWNGPKETADVEARGREHNNNYQPPEPQTQEPPEPKPEPVQTPPKEVEKSSNLQALVDAIGTRMRDIESVVQKMSDKVHQAKPAVEGSSEKRVSAERDGAHKRHKEIKRPSGEDESYKRVSGERDGAHKRLKEIKRPSAEDENYKRFRGLNDRGSKYLHSSADSTTEKPLFIEDTHLTGYYSDASNSIVRRRKNPPKEPAPAPTYMAPVVETRRKAPVHIAVPDNGGDSERKRKKHAHKKRKNKGSRSHKKRSRSKDDKRKHFNRLSSGEAEKNAVSLDDSSDVGQ